MHVQPFAYCPYYCEENIYKLCETFAADDGYNKELSVVFISNDEGKVRSCSKFLGPIRSTEMPLNCSCQLPGHSNAPQMILYAKGGYLRWLQVPIQRQTVVENVGGTVVWDYHVIAVERDGDTSVIYDLTRRVQSARYAAARKILREGVIIPWRLA